MAPPYQISNHRLPSSARDLILRKMEVVGWRYAARHVDCIHELWARAVAAAIANQPITYSRWVSGIEFVIPTVNDGQGFHINVAAWRPLDSQIAGDFASFMSARSYFECGGLISAFIIGKEPNQPSPAFFEWAANVRVTRSLLDEGSRLSFWIKQMRIVHEHYASCSGTSGRSDSTEHKSGH